jgi:hypothetical protein
MEWVKENPAIATAIIAAASAIVGGLIAAVAKFVFDFYLSERMKRRWKTIDTKRQYSSQIIRAAEDLAGRLDNLGRYLGDGRATEWLKPLGDDEMSTVPFRRYYFSSTIYLFCRLIAWIEVLKREQIFLDFASTKETRQFNSYLELIYSIISYSALTGNEYERQVKDHWIYYHYLGGIGESFFKKEEGTTQLRCLTFHEFCQQYKQNASSDFRGWVREVEALVTSLSAVNDLRWARLQMLWICLDEFLDFVDPEKLRTTRDRSGSKNVAGVLRNKVSQQAKRYRLQIS